MNKLLIFGILISFIITGCSTKPSSNLVADVATFVSNSDKVVSYGSVDLDAILTKSALSEVETIGPFVDQQMTAIKGALNVDKKIFYALEGPLDQDGNPEFSYVFMEVKNKDSLIDLFQEMGMLFEEEGDLMTYYDMGSAIAFNDNIAVLVHAGFGTQPKEKLEYVFTKLDGKEKDERVVEVLNQSTDIMTALHLENLYATSNTSLDDLPKKEQKQLAAMVKGGHFSLTTDFNDGNLTMNLNTTRVSDKLKEAYFFKDKSTAETIDNIGPGKPAVALVGALDIQKMEHFVNQFAPGALKSFYSSLGLGGFFLQTMGGEGIASLVNGDFGAMLSFEREEENKQMGQLLNLQAFVKLGEDGNELIDLLDSFSKNDEVEKVEEGYYNYNDALIHVSHNALIYHSNDTSTATFEVGSIDKVEGMDGFGDDPLSIFVNVKQVSEGMSQNMMVPSGFDAVIPLLDYVTLR